MYNQTHTYVCIYVSMCVIYFRTSLRCLHFIISLWLLSRRAYCYYYFLFSCWLLYQFILFCRFSPFACTFRQWPWFFTSPSCCCFCSCCGWYFAVVVAAISVAAAWLVGRLSTGLLVCVSSVSIVGIIVVAHLRKSHQSVSHWRG